VSKILLIDDDSQVNDVVKTSLELLGHTVWTAENAHDAVVAMKDMNPDLTFVDYVLPGSLGLDLIKRLSASHPNAACFLATGMADFSLLKQALRAGAHSMLSKPYRLTDLSELIDLALLLETACQAESGTADLKLERISLSCPSAQGVRSEDLALLMTFARQHDMAPNAVSHDLPIVAAALMNNAATHGSSTEAGAEYCTNLENSDDALMLEVCSSGPEFDWRKTLARCQTGMEKGRASGLQLVLALSDDFSFAEGGRIAKARILKRRTSA